MELFNPFSSIEDEKLRQFIEVLGAWDSLHVGLTSMGTPNVWYAAQSGVVLDFYLEWTPLNSNNTLSKHHFLALVKSNGKYAYDAITCTDKFDHFICQKVTEGKCHN